MFYESSLNILKPKIAICLSRSHLDIFIEGSCDRDLPLLIPVEDVILFVCLLILTCFCKLLNAYFFITFLLMVFILKEYINIFILNKNVNVSSTLVISLCDYLCSIYMYRYPMLAFHQHDNRSTTPL